MNKIYFFAANETYMYHSYVYIQNWVNQTKLKKKINNYIRILSLNLQQEILGRNSILKLRFIRCYSIVRALVRG